MNILMIKMMNCMCKLWRKWTTMSSQRKEREIMKETMHDEHT
jgi:hypothetical protein